MEEENLAMKSQKAGYKKELLKQYEQDLIRKNQAENERATDTNPRPVFNENKRRVDCPGMDAPFEDELRSLKKQKNKEELMRQVEEKQALH